MLNILVTANRHPAPIPEESGRGDMDSYREHPSEFDGTGAAQTTPADDVAAAIGTDERRMHVRAYNYWVSLLEGRDFPSIEDLEPSDVEDFSPHSVLLDFTCGGKNPAMPYLGAAIRDECGLDDDMRNIAEVPSRSLLSRLTDHYLQIIANRAPIGFEAEFENQRSENICYRGILLPFSSDGETIDFIYGVINWKTVEGVATAQLAIAAELPPLDLVEPADDNPVDPDQPIESESAYDEVEPVEAVEAVEPAGPAAEESEPAAHFTWEDGPLADAGE